MAILRNRRHRMHPGCTDPLLNNNIVGGLVNFLSVIDVGKISCTGCISNRKKPFKKNLFKPSTRTKVFFPSSVHTYLHP
jgi:hypothetical protein